jgi:hypothetical protein
MTKFNFYLVDSSWRLFARLTLQFAAYKAPVHQEALM